MQRRKMRVESLEGRRLLAADLGASSPHHNALIAQDVNSDFNVSPLDALLVINEINAGRTGSLTGDSFASSGRMLIDVNDDGMLSPIDALQIINTLNAEGELNPLVSYTAEVTDLNGSPITQVVVGQSFRVTVFAQDTRAEPQGIFTNAVDLGIDDGIEDPDVLSLVSYAFDSSDPAVFDDGISFGDQFPNGKTGRRGDAVAEDYFNEIRSLGGLSSPPEPGAVFKFFSVDLTAESQGTVDFDLNFAEDVPQGQVLLLGSNTPVAESMISYGSASVEVIVDPTSPVANDDTISVSEDTETDLIGGSIDLLLNDSSPASRDLSIVSIDPIAGTTTGVLDRANFTYTPPADLFGNGLDQFTYTIEDSTGLRSTATVTVDVTAINDSPTASDDSLAVDEESVDNTLDVLANDSPGPNESAVDSLTIVSVGSTNNGGTVSIAADGLSLLYTPDPNFVGTETFSYTIRDSGGLEASATVNVDVEPTVLPRARTDRATVAEDSTNNSIDVLANDRANENASPVLIGIKTNGSNGTATVNDNGTPDDATDDFVQYTPNADFFGTDTVVYTMNDTADGSLDSDGTITITVENVNDPVELVDDTANATEDTAATISISSLLANDSPGTGESAVQTLSLVSVSSAATGGSVAIVGSDVVYTPAADFNGSYEFTYVAQDDGSPIESGTATVTVSVAPVNDDPIAGNDTASATEDSSLTIPATTLLSNDSPGPDNEAEQVLSITAVSSSSAQGGVVTLAGTDVIYTPAADYFGADSFTYSLSDGAGGTAIGTVTINVASVNDAPIPGSDSARAFKDIALELTEAELLSNDSPGPANESDQTLKIVGVNATAETNGTVAFDSATGIVTYTPDAGYTGPASFEYTVMDNGTDDGVNVATGIVNITVEEFVPSDITGTVWVDETNDGTIDGEERRLSGVVVTLTGTSLGQTITPQQVLTLSDGSYTFEDLGPGSYVVSFAPLHFMLDGQDVPGTLGDSDSVENQFTINIATPGGADASGYNFGLLGVQPNRARILEQLASRYTLTDRGLALNGAYFGIGADNSQLWGALLDGFDGVLFSEAVLSDDGTELILTVVDANHQTFTAVLNKTRFVKVQDADGSYLVRVLGGYAEHSWQQINRSAPAILSATRYLDAVDTIFDQEDWD